jgi:sterol desaturase/sphingolipid hydroxylase (fatty acid hydroxylase superfamily)
MNLTGLAGPAYFILIAIELIVARRRGLRLYRLNDAINNVSTGILMQLTTIALGGVIVWGYLTVYEDARLADWSPERITTWVACFVAVDFSYYWFHRLSHEVNFLWAAHVVHHQSEEYNLSVALRQSTLQPFFFAAFYLPLAACGFPPLVFFTCSAINTIYQFWLHTQLVGRLGPLEAVLVTPSHHRVHHGRNPVYIDRNHGGTFIVWDRLFGTFEREEEEVVYGITKPLSSWNPVWANLHYWVELSRSARRAGGLMDRFRTFLKFPGWYSEDQGGVQAPPPIENDPVKFDRVYPPGIGAYVLVQFALMTALTVGLILDGGSRGFPMAVVALVGIGWGLVNLGGLFEVKPWSFRSEALRVVLFPIVPMILFPGPEGWAFAALLSVGVAAFGLQMLGVRDGFLDPEAS